MMAGGGGTVVRYLCYPMTAMLAQAAMFLWLGGWGLDILPTPIRP